MNKGAKLIRDILADPDICKNGTVPNALLKEFQKRYPVIGLRKLLLSNDQSVQGVAIFIASELGIRAKNLIADIGTFLYHKDPYFRFYAIDSLLDCVTGSQPEIMGKIVSMLDDTARSVRYKVLDSLSKASIGQLRGALSHFEKAAPDSPHVVCLRWLLGRRSGDRKQIIEFISNKKSLYRKYGAIAAARIALVGDEVLHLASRGADKEIRDFAKAIAKFLRAGYEQ